MNQWVEKTLLMDGDAIRRALIRVAHEIVEKNKGGSDSYRAPIFGLLSSDKLGLSDQGSNTFVAPCYGDGSTLSTYRWATRGDPNTPPYPC